MNRRTFLVFISTFCFAFSVNQVYAQDASPSTLGSPEPQVQAAPDTGINLTVSPSILDIRTEPGASFSAVLKIKNNNSKAESLQINLMKFTADETGSKPKLEPLGSGDIFPQWMNFSETEFIVEGKTWKNIQFTFLPPANASPAYYFAIVFNRKSEANIEDGAVAKGAPAILALAKIASSRVYHQLDLAQLDGGKTFGFKSDKYIYEFLPANFTVTLQNNGNVHEQAYGNIFIDWVSGRKTDIDILNVNQDRSFILPQSTRQFTSTWNNGFPVWEVQKDASGNPILDKKGQPKRKLAWDLNKLKSFRIGKFNAVLTMVYNDGIRDIPLESQVSFWVIPWRILLALLVLLILIIIGLKGTIQNVYDKAKQARDRKRYRTSVPPTNTP